jgi:hypothetical protein
VLTDVSSSDVGVAEDTSLHVIDQAVLGIAREFRFTVEEVKEYYDRCGDVDRTRNRFRRMRELLLQLPDEPPAPQPVTEVQPAPQVSQVVINGDVQSMSAPALPLPM